MVGWSPSAGGELRSHQPLRLAGALAAALRHPPPPFPGLAGSLAGIPSPGPQPWSHTFLSVAGPGVWASCSRSSPSRHRKQGRQMFDKASLLLCVLLLLLLFFTIISPTRWLGPRA